MDILPSGLLNDYKNAVSERFLKEAFDKLTDAELSNDEFSFYTSVASVYSSKIEGETIELDSYIKHKRFGIPFQPDYTRKIDDLYAAYQYAKENPINERTIAIAHRQLAKHIVSKEWGGKFRNANMYVTTPDGRIEYVAALPEMVSTDMGKFYADLHHLVERTLGIQEVFFYASLLHLVFVKIHPWIDGNGRSARLLEKWFIAQHLGPKTWFLQSEKLYHALHADYYRNIRLLGLEYNDLDYSQALPFLTMLPKALNQE